MMRCVRTAGLVLSTAVMLASSCHARESLPALTVSEAVKLALARDALVREAELSLLDARTVLVQTSAYTPELALGARTAAASSTGLDPESAVTGTDYSSQSYDSSVRVPLRGDTSLSVFTSASTNTTNSKLRAGEEEEFTYAGASVGAGISRPLGLFRDERVLTEGDRWSADLGVRGAELSLEQARRQVVEDTLRYFFDAVRAQRQAEIAAASKREEEELHRIAEERLRRGKLAEIEVMEARVSADSAEVRLRKTRSAAATALDALKGYLGLPLDEEVQLSHDATPAGPPASMDEAALVERAFAQRTDLRQLALDVRSAELDVRRTEARSRPGVSLAGGYTRSGEAPTIDESYRHLVNPNWYVVLGLTTSLTREEDRAAIDSARTSFQVAETDEKLRRDAVRLQIRSLMREVENAAANAAQLAETVEVAEENLRIRQVQFEHGLMRAIDVTQTERQLTEARAKLLDAMIDYELASAGLSLAVGEMPAVAAAAAAAGENKEVIQ